MQNKDYRLHQAILDENYLLAFGLAMNMSPREYNEVGVSISVDRFNALNEQGKAPIHIAAESDDPKNLLRLILLVREKIDFNQLDGNGNSPLAIAMDKDKPDAFLAILVGGAEKIRLDQQVDSNGEPILFKAYKEGKLNFFKFITYFSPSLDLGAKDRQGKTIVDLCYKDSDYIFPLAYHSFSANRDQIKQERVNDLLEEIVNDLLEEIVNDFTPSSEEKIRMHNEMIEFVENFINADRSITIDEVSRAIMKPIIPSAASQRLNSTLVDNFMADSR